MRTLLWRPRHRLLNGEIPQPVAAWLLDPGSLTARLKQACGDGFRVRLLEQTRTVPLPDEAMALGMRHGVAGLVREVHLTCHNTPWVYARTIIPPQTLRGPRRRLAHLGSRPLGAYLFADPRLERGPMEIARVPRGHLIWDHAASILDDPPTALWGRRSVFRLKGRPLLVCEFFLPPLVHHGSERSRP